jgi:hypothetical protein
MARGKALAQLRGQVQRGGEHVAAAFGKRIRSVSKRRACTVQVQPSFSQAARASSTEKPVSAAVTGLEMQRRVVVIGEETDDARRAGLWPVEPDARVPEIRDRNARLGERSAGRHQEKAEAKGEGGEALHGRIWRERLFVIKRQRGEPSPVGRGQGEGSAV